MSRVKHFFDRWKTDYDFKTVTAALGSLFVTAIFAPRFPQLLTRNKGKSC